MINQLLTLLGFKKKKKVPPMETEEGFLVIYKGVKQSVEDNLLAVSQQYPALKKTTLYRAFKEQEGQEERKFVKHGYTVKEL